MAPVCRIRQEFFPGLGGRPDSFVFLPWTCFSSRKCRLFCAQRRHARVCLFWTAVVANLSSGRSPQNSVHVVSQQGPSQAVARTYASGTLGEAELLVRFALVNGNDLEVVGPAFFENQSF